MLMESNRIIDDKTRTLYKIFVFIPYVYFLVILNRWATTPMGLHSFGRLWQFFVSYADFGFRKRTLLGSILSSTSLNTILPNEYVFAIAFTALIGAIVTFVIYKLICYAELNKVSALAVALSPALLPHFGYAADNFDAWSFVIVSIMIMNIANIPLLVLGSVVGVLSHEIFLFYVPLLVALLYFEGKTAGHPSYLKSIAAVVVTSVAAYASLKIFGPSKIGQAEYEAFMAKKIPMAAGKNAYWSGYFEMYSTFQENIDISVEPMSRLFKLSSIKYILAPTIYLFLLLSVVVYWLRKQQISLLLMIVAAALAPLAITPVATDFLRWECMACNVALLAILAVARRIQVQIPAPTAYVMIAFFLLAPFGSVPLERPMPVHATILEKFFPSRP